jgi:CheY-like chemotaxis protein
MLVPNIAGPSRRAARHREVVMSRNEHERILVVDDNPIFRETLVSWLRAADYDVVAADSGQRAFFMLRDWQRPIGWLYTRATLPGLIDGWILADEYHDTHVGRAVIIAAPQPRGSREGDIILGQPSPGVVLESIRQLITGRMSVPTAAEIDCGPQQQAA